MFTLEEFNRFVFMVTNRKIYDSIAEIWYGFRHHTRFQKELGELAQRWKKGRLLNTGCGHGPDFIPFKENFELHGIDFSGQMIKQAIRYSLKYNFQPRLAVADLSCLPYADSSFDWAISVASYHHIRDKENRGTAFRELRRVLKPGAEAFITVWNRTQPRFWFKGKETEVDWKTRDNIYYRYYYLFTYGEIEKVIKGSGFQIIRSGSEAGYTLPVKYFSRNICLLVRAV
jgi:ubiquinone/menaquinone biosynthesis C-methylase UbiE